MASNPTDPRSPAQASPAGQVQCRYCGEINPASALICSRCARPLAAPQPPAGSPGAVPANPYAGGNNSGMPRPTPTNPYAQPGTPANPYAQPAAPGGNPYPQPPAPPAANPYPQPAAPGTNPYPQPPAANPYNQPAAPGANPYAQPPAPPAANPYPQPAAPGANPYAQPPAANPYPQPAAPGANPYAQPPAANPYPQPAAPGANPYAQPAAPSAYPYAQPTAPTAPHAPPTIPLPQQQPPAAPPRPQPPPEAARAPIITPSATAGGGSGRLQDQETERYYPNNMGRFVFIALEELLGRNGLNAVLNLAGLSRFINNYPPNNMEKRFSFSHYAAVNKAIEDFYGARGSKGLLLRVGKVSLTHALGMYTAFAGIGNLSMRLMPQSMKVKITLTVIAQTFRTISDQISRVLEEPDAYIFENETCSMCWRRTSSQPCCHIATGVLIAALHWATGKNYKVTEVQCMAMGAPTCRFVIDKQPIE